MSRLPAWVEELQRGFADAVRQPLDRSSVTLRARSEAYEPSLVAATTPTPKLGSAERLAVYNRQYWMRLFTVLHGAYPLLARLLGFWELNRLAELYLTQHPPRSWDIDAIVPGFEPFLATLLTDEVFEVSQPSRRLPSLALREAAAIDAAHHRVFRAPLEPTYTPSPRDSARLFQSPLRFVSGAALLTESWALVELRRQAPTLVGERMLTLGERLAVPRSWLLLRRELSLVLLALEPREMQLLQLLRLHPVAEALGLLEAACSAQELTRLPEQTRGWLARSVKLGLWAQLSAPLP